MIFGIDKEFLKAQFKNIEEAHDLKWNEIEDYGGSLINDKIQINIWSDRYEEGVSTFLTNLHGNEDYEIFELLEKKGMKINNDFLTNDELNYSKSLSMNHSITYKARIILERYCQDVLSGDFSKVGPGESNDF